MSIAAGKRAALLFANGIGERMILREAAAIFDSLCTGLSPRLARHGPSELAVAEAEARRSKPVSECLPSQEPPLLFLTMPKDERDAARDSRDAGSDAEQASGSWGQPPGESTSGDCSPPQGRSARRPSRRRVADRAWRAS
jgi:hypothetical protein